MTSSSARPFHHPTDFVHRLVARLVDDVRIEGLWLEHDAASIQWPPYERLDLHLAVPEPHVESVRSGLQALLRTLDALTAFSQEPAPFKGYGGRGVLSDGSAFSYRIERTSQVAKVPRRHVNVLLDRSGGLLIPALSFVS